MTKIKFLKLCKGVYKVSKKYIKAIIPQKVLLKNESFFRFFYGIFYLGKKHKCNICSKQLRAFISLKNNDLLCPFCGSLSRNRRLWNQLNNDNSLKGNILHFSPSRNLYRKLKKNKEINYISTDYENEFLADYKIDITNINQPNKKFDLIICYHILEHIIEDRKAMSELYRVLKTNGKAYIQTPFKDGDIYEDYSITSPEEREKHFGQDDHVRVYSIDGLKERLELVGFTVNVKTFSPNKDDLFFGFISPETFFIITK